MKLRLFPVFLILMQPFSGYACTLSAEFPFYFLGSKITEDAGGNQALVQYSGQVPRWYKTGAKLEQDYTLRKIDENRITLVNQGQSLTLHIGGCRDQITANNLLPIQNRGAREQSAAKEEFHNEENQLSSTLEPGQSRIFIGSSTASIQAISQAINEEEIPGVDPQALEPGQSRTFNVLPLMQFQPTQAVEDN
jgi:hypothetical protein